MCNSKKGNSLQHFVFAVGQKHDVDILFFLREKMGVGNVRCFKNDSYTFCCDTFGATAGGVEYFEKNELVGGKRTDFESWNSIYVEYFRASELKQKFWRQHFNWPSDVLHKYLFLANNYAPVPDNFKLPRNKYVRSTQIESTTYSMKPLVKSSY